MSIQTALALSRIELAQDLPTQKRVLEHIASLCGSNYNATTFFEALVEREKLGSTYLGHGVALPHARVPGLTEPIAAFLTLKNPLDYSRSENSVDLIFGLFVPQDKHEVHLQLLSSVAARLSQEEIRDALRSAKTSKEVFELLTHVEEKTHFAP